MATRLRLAQAFALVTALAPPLFAQQISTPDMNAFLQRVKADKHLVIALNLNLTDAEGRKFWPVYDAYQKDLERINERLIATIRSYADAYSKGPIAEDVARKLLDDVMAIDEAELQMKKAAVPKILAALPAAKAARYVQIENKIRAAIRYELAANIPLVE